MEQSPSWKANSSSASKNERNKTAHQINFLNKVKFKTIFYTGGENLQKNSY
jgi:hypothetical protein